MPNTGKRLTLAERSRILLLRSQGWTIQKIAQELDVSLFTVQWHLKREAERVAAGK